MICLLNRSRNESGFSLIELMVVVAILGILATIAIPNFQRFQARAKQKSGQALLSGYYTAVKAIHAEYSYYFTPFPTIGFKPEGEVSYHLAAGISTLPGPGLGLPIDEFCVNTYNPLACFINGYEPGVDWTAGLSARNPPDGNVTRNTFTTFVAADLNGAVDDVWSINENKQFINTQPGLP